MGNSACDWSSFNCLWSRLTDCRSTAELRREDSLVTFMAFVLFIRVIYTMLPPHGHCRNIFFINNCKFVLIYIFYQQLQICISIYINISLILNSFYNTALFDKKVSLFNLYAIRVGLDNAATSRILVNPAVILIL